MKRTTLILLTVVYLLSCVGIGISRFYCCGKLASVAITYAAADNANKQTFGKYHCCKHEKQSFKVKDSHINSASFAFSDPLPVILPVLHNWVAADILIEQAIHTQYEANAPPGDTDTPLYIRNCTYRI